MGLEMEMDVPQRYYEIHEILMRCIGQWPYQSKLARNGFLTLLLILFTTQSVPLTMATVKCWDDTQAFLECLSPLIFYLACFIKFVNFEVNSKKMRALLNSMAVNWKLWAHDQEISVLHEYSETGRKVTIAYLVTFQFTGILYLGQPMMGKIIDVLLYNGTEPGEFPYPVYYYRLDEQKYYYYIIGYMYICVPMALTVVIAGDVMFILHVYHCCGILASIGRKLERVGEPKNLRERRRSAYQYLAECIDRHNEAIEFAKLIEETYSACFFFVVGCNMLIMSVTALQIMTRSGKPQNTIRFIVFVGAQIIHLFSESYISQILIDHSTGICGSIQNGKWYETSLKSQRLMKFIMLRSIIPCEVTAGKFCVMSIRTFGAVVKTSVSYFTLLRSVQ